MALDEAADKVKQISDILYKETVLPAKEEGKKIIKEAEALAAEIIHKAKEEASSILRTGASQIHEERRVYEASLEQAIKQALATIKNDVMNLFKEDLLTNLQHTLNEKKVLHDLLQTLIDGIKKEGIKSDLTLCVAKGVDFDALSKGVISSVEKRLEKGEIEISSGIALLVKDRKLTLKITDKTCSELLADRLPGVLRSKVFV